MYCPKQAADYFTAEPFGQPNGSLSFIAHPTLGSEIVKRHHPKTHAMWKSRASFFWIERIKGLIYTSRYSDIQPIHTCCR
jgi:hypothetical protein